MKHLSSSVGARTILATSIMLVPMLLLAVSGAFFITKIVEDVGEAEKEVRRELIPVIELQTLLLKAAMPPNDYLIHGGREEQRNFAQLTEEIDIAFDSLRAHHFGTEQERSLLKQAWNHWNEARALGKKLVQVSFPPTDRQSVGSQMEQFDTSIDKVIADLDQLNKHAITELEEHVARVERTKADASVTTLVAFAIAILIAIIGALVLARTILNPIRTLDEGVSQLREGHLNHRITLPSDDELGRLGKTLNAMATRIEQLATRDELTGLYVRREFNRLFREEMSRAKRSGRPFSLLFVDADHFKDINDRHGHRVGDRVLRTLALVLNRDMRAVDRVARIGGEEFAVLMPDTRSDDAMETAERIRSMAAAKKVRIRGGREVTITISVGVATFPEHGGSMESLVEAADQALYRAKAAGRNCVRRAAATRVTVSTSMGKTG